jgi:hypothetical protein
VIASMMLMLLSDAPTTILLTKSTILHMVLTSLGREFTISSQYTPRASNGRLTCTLFIMGRAHNPSLAVLASC